MKKTNKTEPTKVQMPLDCYECAYNGDCDYLNAKSLMPDAFADCPTKEEEL